MAFLLGNGIWNGVFAVPNAIVDDHIKIASGLSVKVLLLLLRHQGNISPAGIADILGQSPADIQDALNYWSGCGIAAPAGEHNDLPVPPAIPSPAETPAPSSDSSPADIPRMRKIKTISSSHRLSSQEINDMAKTDGTIPCLLQEAEEALGRPLSSMDREIIISLYSYYGMQPDLILLLIHYCVRIDKGSTRYIEKLAADWINRDIDSHEKAEAEIQRLTQRNTIEGKIKNTFGIDRNLITREKNYIQKWTEEYGMELPLITMAFERCIELKNKISFPYINGILSNWHSNGITTPAQASQENREHTSQEKQPAPTANASYDIAELEQMIASEEL